ncbi:MAG: DUF2203 domain-containing protein [Actinomycetota bacterium]
MRERRFTVEEANAALPELTASLARIREARKVVFDHGERVREGSRGNGGGAESPEVVEASRVLKLELERLSEDGIILRDPESGLVDFPAERDGRVVYLCWRLGEDEVAHWHDPDTGFAGRRPLEPPG